MTFSVDIRPALDHIVLTISSGKNKWVFLFFFYPLDSFVEKQGPLTFYCAVD